MQRILHSSRQLLSSAFLIVLIYSCLAHIAGIKSNYLYATTIIQSPIGEFSKNSNAIVRGRVIKIETQSQDGNIFTLTTISPIEVFKGEVKGDFVIKTKGGTYGNVTLQIPGSVGFDEHDENVMFLRQDSTSNESNTFSVAAMAYGKFELSKDTATGQEYLQSGFGDILLDDGSYAKKISMNDFRRIVKNEKASTSDISSQADIVKQDTNEKRSNIIHVDNDSHKDKKIETKTDTTSTNIETKFTSEKEDNSSISWWKFTLIAILGLIAGLYIYNKRQ